jgi:hypothetical protein
MAWSTTMCQNRRTYGTDITRVRPHDGAVRRAIQHRQESLIQLAERYDINPKKRCP